VLYLFLLWVARSALRDLARSSSPAASPDQSDAPGPARLRDEPAGDGLLGLVHPHVEVIAALGHEPGTVFDIAGGATLGRSDHADIRVDDAFASSAHARIFPKGDFMHVEDMGSTNGTYLNGRQLRGVERLKIGDVVRIGDSEYRYQE
jgi:hypothetical protein